MFTVEHFESAVVVTPECDLDLGNRDDFIKCLEEVAGTTTGRVIVSFLHCEYVDSSALNALAIAKRTLRDRLALAVPPGVNVARVFTITDFHKVIPIFASVDQALAA